MAGTGISFVRGSVSELPFDEAEFDVVYANLLFYNLPRHDQQAQAASEMMRVTRPGGRVVIADVDCALCFEPLEPPSREPDSWDYFVGRKLPGLLREVGAVQVGGRISITLDLSDAEPSTWSYNSKCGVVIAWGHKPG